VPDVSPLRRRQLSASWPTLGTSSLSNSYVNAWADWSQYPRQPERVEDRVDPRTRAYKGHVWAITYGMDTRWLYFERDDLQKAGLPADWMPEKLDDVITGRASAVKSKEA